MHYRLSAEEMELLAMHRAKLDAKKLYGQMESPELDDMIQQGIEVELTQKEFEMLYVLLINKGIVLTRQKLLNMVWGEDYYGEERIVDTHIKNIRKKLGVNLISTIRGVGSRIDKEN